MTLPDLRATAERERLEGALATWLPTQRWFGGKARRITGVRVADAAELRDAQPPVLLVLADVAFADGHAERYQVPLADGDDGLPGTGLVDATTDDAAVTALAEGLLTGGARETIAGARVRGRTRADAATPLGRPRRLGVEQSNTSIVFGDDRILKLFRRLEPGLNPDVEITAALTDLGFPHIPAQRGSAELDAGAQVTALAVLADFLEGAREGWALAVEEVGGVVDRGAHGDAPLLPLLEDLGRVVGRLHAALADAFGPVPAGPAEVDAWVEQMHDQVRRVLATAERLAGTRTRVLLARRDELHVRLDKVREVGGGALVRIHGDLHLGQVLLDRDGAWQVLDFEGEPVRTLAERRAHSFPLRDVAGMLRSFDYAAATAATARGVPSAAVAWRDEARARFLDGYRHAAGQGGFLPEAVAADVQLAAFELDKAIYELGYELANRPTWVPIPLGGIERVLDAPPAGRHDGGDSP